MVYKLNNNKHHIFFQKTPLFLNRTPRFLSLSLSLPPDLIPRPDFSPKTHRFSRHRYILYSLYYRILYTLSASVTTSLLSWGTVTHA